MILPATHVKRLCLFVMMMRSLICVGLFFIPISFAWPKRGIAMDAKQVHSTIETCAFVCCMCVFGVFGRMVNNESNNLVTNHSRFGDLKQIH